MDGFKHYKDNSGQVYGFALDGTQDEFIPKDLTSITDAEADALRTQPFTADQMWELIKAERDRRRFEGGVKVGNHWFLSTAIAMGEYNSLTLLSAGQPDNTVLRANWRTIDGAKVDMTVALVRQILLTGFGVIAANDDAAEVHKAAMKASDNPVDYDFSGGWPLIFEA